MSSMSFGVMNCDPTMCSRIVGIRSSIVSITVWPNASRAASSQTAFPASRYGAYCTKQLMTWPPGGAIVGSRSVGMIMSM